MHAGMDARALPGTAYTDPARYEAQRERVLARGWHVLEDRFALGTASAVPCRLLGGSIDEPLMLTREGDQTRALSNVCTHRGALLLDAPCAARSLRCPYHGRRFRLDGTVAAAPGFHAIDDSERLPEVALGTLGPLFFASLEPTVAFDVLVAPLTDRLGFLDLTALAPDPAGTRAFEIDAHWLLWCENYLEGFHIPYVHPRLARALELDRYTIETFDHCALQIGEAAEGDPTFELPPGHPDAARRVAGYYFFVYPTTAINVYPWGVSLNLVRPLGPRRTRIEYRVYVLREDLRERGAGAGLDAVELEDDAIVERAQRGVGARLYRPGRLSGAHEAALAWLHDRLDADCR